MKLKQVDFTLTRLISSQESRLGDKRATCQISFLKSLYKLSIINFTVFYFKLGANHQVRKIMIQYFLKSISYFAESESETFKASKYFIYASKLMEYLWHCP